MYSHGPYRTRLEAGSWHFQHGPIDLVIGVEGDAAACSRVIERCWTEFAGVLPRLVAELAELRRPVHEQPSVAGPVATRMVAACAPFAKDRFITPMAAVAGAVADELIELFRSAGVRRASINNGGDIALHLLPGECYRVGVFANIDRLAAEPAAEHLLDGAFTVDAAMPVRGIATSGWRGRSFSLGIADSVTVLASSAAAADAAATLIANAVNIDCPAVERCPANEIKDDSDLGNRLVTVAVPTLPGDSVARALLHGRQEAVLCLNRGAIYAAVLLLQGQVEIVVSEAASKSPPVFPRSKVPLWSMSVAS